MENKLSTRYFSSIQENYVAKKFNARLASNSGGGKFDKGDVLLDNPSFLFECKTCVKDKDSFSIKKEWLEKNKEESFAKRKDNSCIVFNFGPNRENYYVISEKLMVYLIDKLKGE